MTAQLRHKSKYKKTKRIVIISLLFIGVGMLLPKAISVVSATIMYPVHATNVWFDESSSFIPVLIRSKQALNEEIDSLNNELLIANKLSNTQKRLIEENNRLRVLLGSANETRVAAAVIARPDELPYDLLQIDRGGNDGIQVGSPVFIGKDIVIGLVVHVAPSYSFVELVTTPGFKATAFISGPNVVTTLEGYGGGIARVSVPQGVPLQIGNLVYLPSIEPGIYGRISYIENLPTQSEQYGYVSPDISISGLYLVSVGKQTQVSQSATEIDERILEKIRSELVVPDVSVNNLDAGTTTQDELITPEN